ncbi:MFS transporter [Streptosporangium lutulentum]|uniref:FSR family fosmidomycin resistance protein-like MFS transporter n=1 Tax=Streptosporangium lutulentum TaxID=1461250 RepID=A0ABT9QLK1_9ACTN|nr:MFS transporter [Streptosporangium lutulentum]MDP9847635.1 FSR family fosmidomycin resistance protein-like MFS transporter [Streptosporangium lutulentum]
MTHGVNDFYTGAVAALLPYLVSEQHYDYAAVAGITLAATSLSSIAQPLFGYLSDRYPLRPLILIGLLAAAAGVAVSGLTASSYWTTWAAVALSGIGVAAYHPSATIDAKEAGGGTNRSMSTFSVGGNIGVALAPVAVGASVGVLGLHATPLLAIPTIAVAVVYLAVHRKPSGPLAHAAPAAVSNAAPTAGAKDDWGRFVWLLVVVSFWSIAYVSTTSFVSLYSIQRFHVTAETASLALTVFPAAGAVGTLGGGWFADRFGRLHTIRAGYLIAALAALAIVLAPNTATVVCAAAVLGCALFLPFAPQITLSHAYLPKHIGTASGVTLGLSLSLGGFLTPALGALADDTTIRAVFTLLVALLAIGSVCALFLRERRDRDPVEASPRPSGSSEGEKTV